MEEQNDILAAVKEGFARVDQQFARVDEQFSTGLRELRSELDEKFEKIDTRFEKIDTDLATLRSDLKKVGEDARLAHVQIENLRHDLSIFDEGGATPLGRRVSALEVRVTKLERKPQAKK